MIAYITCTLVATVYGNCYHIPVMKRAYGGMITIEDDGVHCLLMIGGVGSPPTIELPNTQYVKLSSGRVLTNEHNMYNISSGKHVITYNNYIAIIYFIGEWSTPTVIGECTCQTVTVLPSIISTSPKLSYLAAGLVIQVLVAMYM